MESISGKAAEDIFPQKRYMNEQDPHGKSPHEPGSKLDLGKLRSALMLTDFAVALNKISEVTTYGAKKYTPSGWRTVPDGLDRYKDAMVRHLLAYFSGEIIDSESKCSHLSHAAWNMLAILELTENKTASR